MVSSIRAMRECRYRKMFTTMAITATPSRLSPHALTSLAHLLFGPALPSWCCPIRENVMFRSFDGIMLYIPPWFSMMLSSVTTFVVILVVFNKILFCLNFKYYVVMYRCPLWNFTDTGGSGLRRSLVNPAVGREQPEDWRDGYLLLFREVRMSSGHLPFNSIDCLVCMYR